MRWAQLSVCAVFCVVGCANNTARPLPENVVPAGWEDPSLQKSAATSTAGAWWASFDDPVLSGMILTAQKRNLDLRVADARIQEARAARDASGAELWPELTASANVSRSKSTRLGRTNAFGLGADVSWEADVFGRIRSEERAAAAEQAAVEADRGAVELLLTSEVAETYVEYRLRRVQYALAMKNAEAQETTVRISRSRFEQGISSRFDVERALATLALTRSRIPEAQEAAIAARHRLAVLLAETPDALLKLLLDDRPLPNSDPVEVLNTPAEVVARRPDVRATEWRYLSTLAGKDAAERLRYPRLNLAGMIGLDSGDLGELFNPASVIWSLGAGLFAPLFDFGRIRAQIDLADARQERAYLEYELAVRTALEEAQTAIIFYAQGLLRQKELETARTSAQRAADFARLQYREGTVSLLEVLDAERSLNEAELSWSQATADVSLRMIRIHRTLGG
jgi:NodT family efflux transporter outer membrane factor (OMF) lipoprotein